MADHQPKTGSLFTRNPSTGIRVVVTGQVGLDKKDILRRVTEIGKERGQDINVIHVGDRMYAEAPDIAKGRILDLPRHRLEQLRRSVFKDILATAAEGGHLIVNTHATFRWRHGLFHAYDHADMVKLHADLYITLVDNFESVHERLKREHDIRHTLKDILVWREEEIVLTRAMAEAVSSAEHAFIVSRGDAESAAKTIHRLMFERFRKRVYPSFPMTHVAKLPKVLAKIERFRRSLNDHFITFDPGDLDEKDLLYQAGTAAQRGESEITVKVNGRDLTLRVADITDVTHDIDAQIYARDFMLIDQSDMIVSFIPALPDGAPGLSSGVERELQHAFETTKEVFIIWASKTEPSPFVPATATKVFSDLDDLYTYFQQRGYINTYQPDLPHAES